jgi:hypothetical protein
MTVEAISREEEHCLRDLTQHAEKWLVARVAGDRELQDAVAEDMEATLGNFRRAERKRRRDAKRDAKNAAKT